MINPNKLALFILYLQKGGEIEIDGVTYVWLDNYVTSISDTRVLVIYGLAIKGTSYPAGREEEARVHYMGTRDMTLEYFCHLVESIDDRRWKEIVKELDK